MEEKGNFANISKNYLNGNYSLQPNKIQNLVEPQFCNTIINKTVACILLLILN